MRLLQSVFFVILGLASAALLSAQVNQGGRPPAEPTTARPGQTSETPRQPSEPPRPTSDAPRPTSEPPRPTSEPPRPVTEPPRPISEPSRPSAEIGRPPAEPPAAAQAAQRQCGNSSTTSSTPGSSSTTAASSAFPGVSAAQSPRAGVSADAFERPGVSTAQLATLLPGARRTPCAPPRDVILYPENGTPARRLPPPGENN